MRPLRSSSAGVQRDPRQLLMEFGGAVRGQARERGPGLSRATFRLVRLWKKRWVRRTVLGILPAVALALGVGRLAADPEIRRSLEERLHAAVAAVSSRPEFAVRGLTVTGGSARLQREIVEAVRLPSGASSLTLDIATVRARVADLGAVRSARVTLGSDGMLTIDGVTAMASSRSSLTPA